MRIVGPEIGLSCAFRQWRAALHCRFLHGYSLSFIFVFETQILDEQGWVVDFGGLKDLKSGLQEMFDHTTAVAANDPHLAYFEQADRLGAIDFGSYRTAWDANGSPNMPTAWSSTSLRPVS
ncbi:Queuosine biosynthesis QueD, PTPS-I [Candidatus Paraburkholderia calva]|nr:Queuosine biosynthesis QueD, PTPS-I [Candidatus Paraburkholderia calva]